MLALLRGSLPPAISQERTWVGGWQAGEGRGGEGMQVGVRALRVCVTGVAGIGAEGVAQHLGG